MSETSKRHNELMAARTEKLFLAVMAAGGIALSGGVIASILYLLMTLASLITFGPSARGQSTPGPAQMSVEAATSLEGVEFQRTLAVDIFLGVALTRPLPRPRYLGSRH